jgi:HlyD family secretion protein
MMKKSIIAVIILVLLAGGYLGWRQYQANQQAKTDSQYQTTPADRGNLTATVGATGTVHANQTATLAWQTSGDVKQVVISVGDLISAGQVLANLETTSLPQSVILAQSDLENAQKSRDDLYTNAEIAKTGALHDIANYAQAVRDAQYQLDNFTVPTDQADLNTIDALDKMKQKLDLARQAFDPYKFASVENSTRKDLKKALDEAQSDYNAAVKRLDYEYNLEVAEANLKKARYDYDTWKDGPNPADVASIETRIAAAQATLNLSRIAAPFAGTVTSVDVKPGDQVNPGTVAFRLDDLSHLFVDVQVSEVDINRIKSGQDVSLTFDAILNKEYQGIVNEVATVGTVNQGVVDFKVTVELTDADELVKPGMTAAVNIVVNRLENVLLVPNRAVRLLDGKRVVYILTNGKPTPVNITLGASSDTSSEVTAGDLKLGDPIVLNPPVVFNQNGPPPFVQQQ